MMNEKKLVHPNEGYSSSGSDADYEQPMTDKEFIKWLDVHGCDYEQPMTRKRFIKWLNTHAPVDYEEVQHFSDEAGASIWIRFDLEKEEDDG